MKKDKNIVVRVTNEELEIIKGKAQYFKRRSQEFRRHQNKRGD